MCAGFGCFLGMSSDAAVFYVPTLEKLRAATYLDIVPPLGEPQEVERVAMLVVQAALVRRTSWTEEVQNAPGYLQRGEPPPPVDDQPRHHVRIDERLGGATCLACLDRPGFRRCRVCGGRGRIMNDTQLCSCKAGWVPCANCGGHVQIERVRLRYFSDTPAYLNEAYMPTHIAQNGGLFSLETFMEKDLNLVRTPPEELRCHDLTGEVQGTAYRGGNKKIRPSFHGHDFGDSIDLALAGLAAAGAGAKVARYQVRAYAWPFLHLQWADGRHWAVYTDRSGSIRVFRGRRPGES
jgi:hypothetical protein